MLNKKRSIKIIMCFVTVFVAMAVVMVLLKVQFEHTNALNSNKIGQLRQEISSCQAIIDTQQSNISQNNEMIADYSHQIGELNEELKAAQNQLKKISPKK